MKNKGFTLIELVIVSTLVLMVLAAIGGITIGLAVHFHREAVAKQQIVQPAKTNVVEIGK